MRDLVSGPEIRVLSPIQDLVVIQGVGLVGVTEKDAELCETLLRSEGCHGVGYRWHPAR